MEKFERAYVESKERQRILREYLEKWNAPGGREWFAKFKITSEEQIEDIVSKSVDGEIWKNDKYQVTVYRDEQYQEGWPTMVHLSIRTLDRQPSRDWREFQEIKNELVGPECEGVELYPAESRCVDLANQFHLWVIQTPEIQFPFGFHEGRQVDSDQIAGSVQRELP